MTLRFAWIAAVFSVLPFAANALTVSKLPEGMCTLDAKIPVHATILQYFSASAAAGNELITGFASCDELEAIADKKATSVSHYGSVLRQTTPVELTMDRATYIKTVATAMQKSAELTKTALSSVGALSAQGATASGTATPQNVAATPKGVLYQDPRMVIIGMEQTNHFGNQSTQVASTAAMTMVGGAPISVNLYAPLTEKDAFAKSVEALKPTVNAMVRENQ